MKLSLLNPITALKVNTAKPPGHKLRSLPVQIKDNPSVSTKDIFNGPRTKFAFGPKTFLVLYYWYSTGLPPRVISIQWNWVPE